MYLHLIDYDSRARREACGVRKVGSCCDAVFVCPASPFAGGVEVADVVGRADAAAGAGPVVDAGVAGDRPAPSARRHGHARESSSKTAQSASVGELPPCAAALPTAPERRGSLSARPEHRVRTWWVGFVVRGRSSRRRRISMNSRPAFLTRSSARSTIRWRPATRRPVLQTDRPPQWLHDCVWQRSAPTRAAPFAYQRHSAVLSA